MAPKRTTDINARLFAQRTKHDMTQTDFAKKFFKVRLRTYQRWESTLAHSELPGPVQVIIEALERGGTLPK
jgi:DNA-binding transcriptional regulator YiaG